MGMPRRAAFSSISAGLAGGVAPDPSPEKPAQRAVLCGAGAPCISLASTMEVLSPGDYRPAIPVSGSDQLIPLDGGNEGVPELLAVFFDEAALRSLLWCQFRGTWGPPKGKMRAGRVRTDWPPAAAERRTFLRSQDPRWNSTPPAYRARSGPTSRSIILQQVFHHAGM